MPFGAAHTYIAYIRDYPHPPGQKARCRLRVSLLTQARLITSMKRDRTRRYRSVHVGVVIVELIVNGEE